MGADCCPPARDAFLVPLGTSVPAGDVATGDQDAAPNAGREDEERAGDL